MSNKKALLEGLRLAYRMHMAIRGNKRLAWLEAAIDRAATTESGETDRKEADP